MRIFTRALVALVPAAIAFGGLTGFANAQAAPGMIDLVIDLGTGNAQLVGNNAQPAELSFYQVDSPTAQLLNANWDPIAPDGGFAVFTNTSAQVSELSLASFVLIDANGRSIGNIFDTTGPQNLMFTWFNNDNQVFTGDVIYIPEPASAGLLLLGGGLALVRRRR